MILTSEGYALEYEGQLLERKVSSLSFQVRGDRFPMPSTSNLTNAYFLIISKVGSTVTVDWGDGTMDTHTVTSDPWSVYVLWSANGNAPGSFPNHTSPKPPHIFQDGNTGVRTITFRFSSILDVSQIRWALIFSEGVFPADILYFENLNNLTLSQTQRFTSFPRDLSRLQKLQTLVTNNAFPDKLLQIPDSVFQLPLKSFDGSSQYNLSDPVSSNFFKMDQLSDTLESLRLSNCNISTFDERFGTLTKLYNLRIDGNVLSENPPNIENFTELTILYIFPATLIDHRNHNKLKSLWIWGASIDLTNLEIYWSGLYSLNQIVQFSSLINSTPRFDEFIHRFYTVCTQEGSITPNGSPAPYPNRFRNIAWGHSSLQFSGAKVAPAGYVQGSDNGTPTTPGQKVYVLQNQYGHTVTHGTPVNPTTKYMGTYGTIVSGWEASEITGGDNTQIATWEDSYNANNLTSQDQTKTVLRIVGGKKEVDFNDSLFSGGRPANLNFIGTQNSFSVVCHVGSRLDWTAFPYLWMSIVSWAGGNAPSQQYMLTVRPPGDDGLRSQTVGGATTNQATADIQPNDVIGITYDHTTNRVSAYINGTEVLSDVIPATAVTNTVNELQVGGRLGLYDKWQGSMRGLWMYNNVLNQPTMQAITTKLNE